MSLFDEIDNSGQRPATLLKKRLWHRYFPLNFAKHLFLQNAFGGCFCISNSGYRRKINSLLFFTNIKSILHETFHAL